MKRNNSNNNTKKKIYNAHIVMNHESEAWIHEYMKVSGQQKKQITMGKKQADDDLLKLHFEFLGFRLVRLEIKRFVEYHRSA